VLLECLSGQLCVNATLLSRSTPLSSRTWLQDRDEISFHGNAIHSFVFASTPDSSGTALLPNTVADAFLGAGIPPPPPALLFTRSLSASAVAVAHAVAEDHERRVDALEGGEGGSRKRQKSADDAEERKTASEARALRLEQRKKQLHADFEALVVLPEKNTAPPINELRFRVLESHKNVLLDSIAPFVLGGGSVLASFSTVCPCLMLEGPYGTEILLAELAAAAAKHLGSSMLVLDHHAVLTVDSEYSAAFEADPDPSPRDQLFSRLLSSKSRASQAPTSKGGKPFQKGDRVRFVGDRNKSATDSSKGPAVGAVGEIIFLMEDERAAGVLFDLPVMGGVEFGQNRGHDQKFGYFCPLTSIRPEEDGQDSDVEGLAIDALVSVAAAHAPCVVLFRDAEGVALSSLTRFRKLQQTLAKLPNGVVVLGIRPLVRPSRPATGSDRGDRSMSGSSGSSSLMDFAFLSDSGVRFPRDDLSEPGRAMVNKIFASRISVTAPPRNPGGVCPGCVGVFFFSFFFCYQSWLFGKSIWKKTFEH
jgi:hypothetical protein